jgi:hypothetical protein
MASCVIKTCFWNAQTQRYASICSKIGLNQATLNRALLKELIVYWIFLVLTYAFSENRYYLKAILNLKIINEYLQLVASSSIIINRIAFLSDNQNIQTLLKDMSESARLAGLESHKTMWNFTYIKPI